MKNEIWQKVYNDRNVVRFNKNTRLVERHKERVLEGVLVARLLDTGDSGRKIVSFGFSALNPRDEFNLEIGLQIARNKDREDGSRIPNRILPHLERFKNRARKYFKDAEL
jgi:hypothetical protein